MITTSTYRLCVSLRFAFFNESWWFDAVSESLNWDDFATGVCALVEGPFDGLSFTVDTEIACAIGCNAPFCRTKQFWSGFVTPVDTFLGIILKLFKMFRFFFASVVTYKGPGNTFAPRIRAYGIMMIGVVGRAKNGCDGPIAFEFSSVLFCWTGFWVTAFAAEVGGPDLIAIKIYDKSP